MDAERFLERHVIITGGTSGIGLAAAHTLVDAGARVSVISRDGTNLAAMRADPPHGRHDVVLEAADVAVREQVDAAVAACIEGHGPPDVLITSAGIAIPDGFLELDPVDFERQMAVNYFGTLWPIRAVAPSMIERQRGRIACISSVAGFIGVFGYSGYAPTKFAVAGLCQVVRMELKPYGISVSCVFPPDVDTPMLAGEEATKPRETKALAGSIKALTAQQVVDATLDGLERGRPEILIDPMSRLTRMVNNLTPRLLRLYLDSVVAKVGARAERSEARPG